jgi:hypothetical protein
MARADDPKLHLDSAGRCPICREVIPADLQERHEAGTDVRWSVAFCPAQDTLFQREREERETPSDILRMRF